MRHISRQLDVGLVRDRFFRKAKAKHAHDELMAWPDSLKDIWPDAVESHTEFGSTYSNYKIGCFSGIISGDDSDSWPDHRRDALRALLRAFDIVQAERPETVDGSAAILLTWPNMFGSEICLFFDADKESGFTPEAYSKSAEPTETTSDTSVLLTSAPGPNPFEIMDIPLPANTTLGGFHFRDIDLETGEEWASTHWSLMRDERVGHPGKTCVQTTETTKA